MDFARALRIVPLSRQDGGDFRLTGKTSLKSAASPPSQLDADLVRTLAAIPALLEQNPYDVTIRAGRLTDLMPRPRNTAPVLSEVLTQSISTQQGEHV